MRAGDPNLDFLSIYNCMIRPVLKFAAPAFHSVLSDAQSRELEQMQARAFKLNFGWNMSYRVALLASGAERLEDRRKVLEDNFANKYLKNPRFINWFPLNRDAPYPTQRREKFFIKQSRTTRHQKNPHNYMRRRMNELHMID